MHCLMFYPGPAVLKHQWGKKTINSSEISNAKDEMGSHVFGVPKRSAAIKAAKMLITVTLECAYDTQH